MIQIIPVDLLDDKKSKEIMKDINEIGRNILKHEFGLSYAGTGNLYYSIMETLVKKLQNVPIINCYLKNYSEKLLNKLIKDGKIPIYSPPDWVYTRNQLIRAISPWSLRYAEYPWAIFNSKLNKHMKILDVGGGLSLFPLYLTSLGHEVFTIDTDSILINKITPWFQEWTGLKVNYGVGDATKIDFPDNTFDRIFCISVLEHLEEKIIDGKLVNDHKHNLDIKAISEMLRVLKPRGLLIITLDWSESKTENRSYCFDDIYFRLLSPFRSNLLSDKKPEFDWNILKEKHQQAWKSRYPYYFSMDGWSVGIIMQK